MRYNFKNRIAFHYMIATAITMAMAFVVIYLVVSQTVWRNLDHDLSYEAHKHTDEIKSLGDSITFKNKEEWREREHQEVQVNPVFLQLIDRKGRVMDKSPNLKQDQLLFNASASGGHFDSEISNRAIRQAQVPLEWKGQTIGYILAAMSSESEISTLLKLRNVLVVSFLLILVGLYFISRYLAGRSIKPVQSVTKTITRITKNNLKERVVLPVHRDEIYNLSNSFNALLDRIEFALERERQFTSDASHELRTPLAVLRGTLEVLIRKPRTTEEYEAKVKYSLLEIEKMTTTIEQLLLLARLEGSAEKLDRNPIALPTIIDESLSHFKNEIKSKNLTVELNFDHDKQYLVPHYYTNLIIDNILGNAVKYSNNNTTIKIQIKEAEGQLVCTIQDEGIGINQEDLKNIYNSFFRSEALSHKHISGNGLGLSIVKKCTDAIKADLNIQSTLGKGTTVTIKF